MTPQEIEALRSEALKDKVEALSDMVDIMKAERDALAAWVNDACALFTRIAQSEEAVISNDVKKIIDSELVYDISDFVEYKTPQQCLRDVQADAGRAGFIAGCLYDNEIHFNDATFDINTGADMYAAKVRQGGTE